MAGRPKSRERAARMAAARRNPKKPKAPPKLVTRWVKGRGGKKFQTTVLVKPKRDTRGHTAVNAVVRVPKSPGPWVNEEVNLVTGERFEDFHPRISFAEARRRVAASNGERAEHGPSGWGKTGGTGYISRGPVLWMMHVMKLEAWYEHCYPDGAGWDFARRRPFGTPDRATKRVTKTERTGRKRRVARGRGRIVDITDVPF